MGLTKEQRLERTKKTRDIKTVRPENGEKYVFVSYKSNDWKIVLDTIVRDMQDRYGLRVYFDKNFEGDNKIWTENMKDAIKSSHCVAVLAFLSKEYMKSPACLMEILEARTWEAERRHADKPLNIISIIIDKDYSEIKDLMSEGDHKTHIDKEEVHYDSIVAGVKKSWYVESQKNKDVSRLLELLEETGESGIIEESDISYILQGLLKKSGYVREYISEIADYFYENLYETIKRIEKEANIKGDAFDPALKSTVSRNANAEPNHASSALQAAMTTDSADIQTKKMTGNAASQTAKTSAGTDLQVEKTIKDTDVTYKICTFGSKFHIGFGEQVTVEFNGRTYSGKMHSSTKGRVDGLSRLYNENHLAVGDVLRAAYSSAENKITLKRIEK